MGKAFIFDIDGTLLDTERIYIASWKQAAAEQGYTLSDELMLRTRSRSTAQGRQIMQEALGLDFPYDEIRKRRVELAEAAIAKDDALLKPGAKALLLALQERRIPFAAATSTGKAHTQAHLAIAGLDRLLIHRITGDMVARGKPNPDIFLEAAALLGVAPENCLVVEDSHPGLAAAKAAGMRSLWIPDQSTNPNPADAECLRRYQSLWEVLEDIPNLL